MEITISFGSDVRVVTPGSITDMELFPQSMRETQRSPFHVS